MLLLGNQREIIQDPRGAWTRTDQLRGQPRRGSAALNMRFEPKRAKSREGTIATAYSTGEAVTSAYHWLTQDSVAGAVNRLLYFEKTNKVKILDLLGSGQVTLFTTSSTVRGIKVAEAGPRCFISCYNSGGVGVEQVRIVNPLISGQPVDKAFAPPMTITPTMSDAGSGQITAGPHNFGYIMETRSGFSGKESPAPGDVFTPVSFTVASGGRSVTMTITGTMPPDAAFIQPIMTRTDNLAKYYRVPLSSIAVPPGVSYTALITFSISDSDLATNTGDLLVSTDTPNYITQSVSGSGPFSPSVVVALGRRMGYVVFNKLYVSDIDNAQVITEDQHVIQIPGQMQIVTAFALGAVIYIVGPRWTYAVTDSGDVPKLWGTPQVISRKIGTPSVNGVSASAEGNYAIVANDMGAYYFDGQYADKPMSYMNQPDWKTINWAAPNSIHVVDVPKEQRVEIVCPIKPDTEPTKTAAFHYSKSLSPLRGMSSETVDFSWQQYGFGGFGTVVPVLSPTTGELEHWIMPASATHMRKHSDDARDDDGTVLNAYWETGQVQTSPRADSNTCRFNAIQVECKGEGDLQTRMYARGRHDYADIDSPFALEPYPEDDPVEAIDILANNVSIHFEVNAIGHWFDLATVTVYWTPYLTASGGM